MSLQTPERAGVLAGTRLGPPTTRRRRRRAYRVNWWLTALMAVLALTVLAPLYFTLATALKTPADLAASPWGLPTDPVWSNFSEAWRLTDFPRTALNSALITVGAVILALLTNSMVAYAISRNMKRKLFKGMFFYFISALFVPFPIIMLPMIKWAAFLHMDNRFGLILLYVVYGLAITIFLYVGYLRSIPQEIEEAAYVDGASVWTTFWKVIFPLLAPINATVGIITCVWAWNDFMLPLVILSHPDDRTLPLAQYVFQGQFTTNYTVGFASYLMALAPMLIVYLFAQRWVISGVTRGSIK
jgi:raffinose/stachyose/melibiose transport system permease protein